MTANLPAGNVLLGFRYWTDTNTGGFGFMADDINVTGFATDGAETDAGWTYKPTTGFHVTTARSPPCTTSTTWPSTARTRATTRPSRPARTSSAT